MTILIYSSWISWIEQLLLVDFANYFDYLHWNYYNFDAMKREVAPIACRIDFGVFIDLSRKLSKITTAIW